MKRCRFVAILSLFVVVLIDLLATMSLLSAQTIRTVALTGKQAPGTTIGTTYFDFSFHLPVLNDAGQTAFWASLTGSGVTADNRESIWSEAKGNLTPAVRSGSSAPGIPDAKFHGFFPPTLNDAGQTAFKAYLTGDGVNFSNRESLWAEGTAGLELVARAQNQAAGLPSEIRFSSFLTHTLNNVGDTAFFAWLEGPDVDSTNNESIWLKRADTLTLAARRGDPAPGMPNGMAFGELFAPLLNDAGQVAFRSFLSGGGLESGTEGIWSGAPENLALVARSGDHAPGTSSAVEFSSFEAFDALHLPALNNSGQVAFRARLVGVGIDSANRQGIWSQGSGNLALVAQTGSHAPGTPSGVVFRELFPPVLNNLGQSTFSGRLTGGDVVEFVNDSGIWLEDSGDVKLVARTGTHAPGTASGVNFTGLGGHVLNNAGQIAFSATLSGVGEGIWATDRNGEVQLIVRSGDQLEVAPDDYRTVRWLYFQPEIQSGTSDGRANAFNNLGQIAFRAAFTDGSEGIFVSNRVAIPEPSSFFLAALGLLGACTSRVRI